METVSVIAEILLKLVQAAPTIVKTVEDLLPLAGDIKQVASGDTMTQEQKDALDARITELYDELQTPLPPE